MIPDIMTKCVSRICNGQWEPRAYTNLQAGPAVPGRGESDPQNSDLRQAVFAALLNVTTDYVSELERGTKRPARTTLGLLHIIRRKGIEAVL
jgi:putative transcriptional regulator